jgi:hypothetical protein
VRRGRARCHSRGRRGAPLYVLRPLQPAVAPGPPVVSRARPRPEGGGFLQWHGSSTQEIHATAICLVLPTQRRRRLNSTDPSTNPCEPLDHRFAYTRLHIDERLFKQKRFLRPQVCFQMRLGSARLASFHVPWHSLFPRCKPTRLLFNGSCPRPKTSCASVAVSIDPCDNAMLSQAATQ